MYFCHFHPPFLFLISSRSHWTPSQQLLFSCLFVVVLMIFLCFTESKWGCLQLPFTFLWCQGLNLWLHTIDKHYTSELYHQPSPIALTLPPMIYKGLWLIQSGPSCFLTICQLLFLPGVCSVSSDIPLLFKHQTYCFCRASLLSPFSQNVLDPLFNSCLLHSAVNSSTPTSLERPFLSPI